MRQVLIAVAGGTPQIITETIWSLARRHLPPVRIESVHIATTTSALLRVGLPGLFNALYMKLNEHKAGMPPMAIR